MSKPFRGISAYSKHIKGYNRIFDDTVRIYRDAVQFLIEVCVNEWSQLCDIKSLVYQQKAVEHLVHATSGNPSPKYDFNARFYKMPSYLRRSSISDALGKVQSYVSNLKHGEQSVPQAGHTFPCLYKDNMYKAGDTYSARIKVFIRNTWDWLDVKLRKSDCDYISHHCSHMKECAPTLTKRGKQWFLSFPYEEQFILNDTPVREQTIAAVDLGINSSATVSVMKSDGTILARRFFRQPVLEDSLKHKTNRIKKAQQYGNHRTPRLWTLAKGVNDAMAVNTAAFIISAAAEFDVSTIVFEYLDTAGKKSGRSKRQRLALWNHQYVQEIVEHRAHRSGIHVSRVNPWGTSKYAYDDSGIVERGIDGNYSICKFQNGKVYNCDLNASYNIGARYFVREILKSLSATARLAIEAKVPQCAKRTTCTLSTLISMNAVLTGIA